MDDEIRRPPSPAEVLREQQAAFDRVSEALNRLVAVATNKNAEVGSAVEAAQAAIKGQREALEKAAKAASTAETAHNTAATKLDAAKGAFVDGVGGLSTATDDLKDQTKTLAQMVGNIRTKRQQNLMLTAAFAAGAVVVPWLFSLVPGLADMTATAIMHHSLGAVGRAEAGTDLISHVAPKDGAAIANYLSKAPLQ